MTSTAEYHGRRNYLLIDEVATVRRFLAGLGVMYGPSPARDLEAPHLVVYDPPPCGGYVGVALWLHASRRSGPFGPKQIERAKNLEARAWATRCCSSADEAIDYLSELGWGQTSAPRDTVGLR